MPGQALARSPKNTSAHLILARPPHHALQFRHYEGRSGLSEAISRGYGKKFGRVGERSVAGSWFHPRRERASLEWQKDAPLAR
jgi:hypothetical protein